MAVLLYLMLSFYSLLLTEAYADTQTSNPQVESVVHIKVDGAYVRASIPGQRTSAAYFSIYNGNEQDAELINVKSNVGHAMVHKTEYVDGMAKMRHAGRIRIPAKGRVELKPGGTHIMLMGLREPLKEGDELTLTLVFANLPDQELKVQVK